LLTKVRTLIHEEISLLTVLYFPFRVVTPSNAQTDLSKYSWPHYGFSRPFMHPAAAIEKRWKVLLPLGPLDGSKGYNLGGPPEVLSEFSYSAISPFTVA
jgi:hypothetical protein